MVTLYFQPWYVVSLVPLQWLQSPPLEVTVLFQHMEAQLVALSVYSPSNTGVSHTLDVPLWITVDNPGVTHQYTIRMIIYGAIV